MKTFSRPYQLMSVFLLAAFLTATTLPDDKVKLRLTLKPGDTFRTSATLAMTMEMDLTQIARLPDSLRVNKDVPVPDKIYIKMNMATTYAGLVTRVEDSVYTVQTTIERSTSGLSISGDARQEDLTPEAVAFDTVSGKSIVMKVNTQGEVTEFSEIPDLAETSATADTTALQAAAFMSLFSEVMAADFVNSPFIISYSEKEVGQNDTWWTDFETQHRLIMQDSRKAYVGTTSASFLEIQESEDVIFEWSPVTGEGISMIDKATGHVLHSIRQETASGTAIMRVDPEQYGVDSLVMPVVLTAQLSMEKTI